MRAAGASALDPLPARDHLADPTALTDVASELHRRIGALPRALDRRVAAPIEALRTAGIDHRPELARIPISRAHLRALFARDVGAQIPTQAPWRRLLDALAAFTGDATAAAHAAGFAELVHFSRTCRQMLGYSPTTLPRSRRAQAPRTSSPRAHEIDQHVHQAAHRRCITGD